MSLNRVEDFFIADVGIAIGSQGATTTFGYDAFGVRVLQTGTSTTTLYPFKWYTVASSTGTGAKYATTTDYVFNGDTQIGGQRGRADRGLRLKENSAFYKPHSAGRHSPDLLGHYARPLDHDYFWT